MKSEHRHELKTHELGRLAEQALQLFEKYGNQVLVVLCGVLIVAGGAIYWNHSSTDSASAGWTQLAAARSAEDFAGVADSFPDTKVGAWARLNEAEGRFRSGVQLAFTDRQAGVSDLKKAKKSFGKLLADGATPRDVRERALFGLARCLETMSEGDTDESIAAYEKLLQDFPQTIYKDWAQRRIAVLKTGRVQEFYAWFQKQNPKPSDRKTPRDGFPAGHPPIDDITLPEIPERLRLPEPAGDKKSDGKKAKADDQQGPALKPEKSEKPGQAKN